VPNIEQAFKFSKNIDEGEFFISRSDYARATTQKTEVIEIDKH
jgi:hypothetical protein